MKLKIFNEDEKVGAEREVYLRLEYGSKDKVLVCACDEKGVTLTCGNLVAFYPDGTMGKMSGVSGELGFQLKMGGQIQERGEY